MLQHAAQHASIAGTDDQDARCLSMDQKRNMGEHLLINELVTLSDLDHAVQNENATMRLAVEDENVLEVTPQLC